MTHTRDQLKTYYLFNCKHKPNLKYENSVNQSVKAEYIDTARIYEKLCYFKSLVITAYGAIIIWMRTTLYNAALKLIILDKNYDYANILYKYAVCTQYSWSKDAYICELR